MAFVTLNDVTLHYHLIGGSGAPMVFLNSLGTDFRIWDDVTEHLGDASPKLFMDKRGHGLSDNGTISIDILVNDTAAMMDYLGLSGALICGVSVGGMIAQGLAATRPDLVSGLVLCCTGAKIGTDQMWNERIQTVEFDGIEVISDQILERWFAQTYRGTQPTNLAGYGNMLTRTSVEGYVGVCVAVRDADLRGLGISVPTQCIAGSDDMSTPPDLVKSLADGIADAGFQVIENCGHLPCIEAPAVVAQAIRDVQVRIAQSA